MLKIRNTADYAPIPLASSDYLPHLNQLSIFARPPNPTAE